MLITRAASRAGARQQPAAQRHQPRAARLSTVLEHRMVRAARASMAKLRYAARRPQAAPTAANDARFLAAAGRTLGPLATLDQAAESEWAGPFFFAQLADTQFGMFKEDETWAEEEALAEAAVAHINRLKPKFVVVCGDLVNAMPNGGAPRPEQQEEQVRDYKRVMGGIDESIQLVCVCGNHDVGDRPNAATIDLYETRFGDTYLAFWAGGCRCIVLNSSLHASEEEGTWDMSCGNTARFGDQSPESVLSDKKEAQALAREQEAWLDAELSSAAANGAQHSIVFTHIPPFIEDPDEPKGYFNYDPSVREPLLRKLRGAGVSKWFCGHYHRNAGGVFVCDEGELEVVTTAAVGTHLIAKPDSTLEERIGLDGFSFPAALSEQESGFRLVAVGEDRISHKWFNMASMPAAVTDPAAAAADDVWVDGGDGTTRPRL